MPLLLVVLTRSSHDPAVDGIRSGGSSPPSSQRPHLGPPAPVPLPARAAPSLEPQTLALGLQGPLLLRLAQAVCTCRVCQHLLIPCRLSTVAAAFLQEAARDK